MTIESVIHLGDSRTLHEKIDRPINLLCTDPPYGMAHLSGSAETAAGKRWVREVANDQDIDGAIAMFLEVMPPLVEKTANDCDMYIFTRHLLLGEWIRVVNMLDPFVVKNVLVWDKGTPGMGDTEGNWAFTWEAIIYAKKGRIETASRRSSIISVDRDSHHHMIHPTQKPVRLLEVLIEQSTQAGDLVVDPFAGSGSTIVAAQNLGRQGIGMELDEIHVANSRLRLSQMVFDL